MVRTTEASVNLLICTDCLFVATTAKSTAFRGRHVTVAVPVWVVTGSPLRLGCLPDGI